MATWPLVVYRFRFGLPAADGRYFGAIGALFMLCLQRLVTLWADRAMFLLLLDGRRHQLQNRGHRTSGIDVHRPYLCQRHHRHCSLDKF